MADKTNPLQRILDVAGVLILVLDTEGRIQLINRKGCQVLGAPEEDLLGKEWFEHFVPERLKSSVRSLFEGLRTKKNKAAEYNENPILTVDGRERVIAWHNVVLEDDDGKVTGILSSGEDITERVQAEEALRLSESRLRGLLDTVVDGIITIDETGVIGSFNRGAERIFGYTAQEVIGRSVNILMTERDAGRHDTYIGNYLRSGEPKIIGIGREVMGKKKDGTIFPLYLSVGEMEWGGRKMFTGVLRDFTDFRKMQEEVLQVRNLAAIGEMAASVAHEIKNPIAGISGAVQVIRDQMGSDNPHREVIEEVFDQVNRLNETIRHLLMFARTWEAERISCCISDLVREISSEVQEIEDFQGVEFEFSGETTMRGSIDPGLFKHVLRNILENAAYSMPGGGLITYVFEDGADTARLRIQDTGSGIPDEAADKIFRPFFTTKTRGTGLGLPICRKIMEAHGGGISVHALHQEGTEVVLEFPKG